MLDDIGYMLTSGSPLVKRLRGWLAKQVRKAPHGAVVELAKERNVYNLYLQAPKAKAAQKEVRFEGQDVCPASVVQHGGASSAGGPWRGEPRP